MQGVSQAVTYDYRPQRECVCVADHTPEPAKTQGHHVWPVWMGGPDKGELEHVCGTTHDAVHEYIRALIAFWPEAPPYQVRREFTDYQRRLAMHGLSLAITGGWRSPKWEVRT